MVHLFREPKLQECAFYKCACTSVNQWDTLEKSSKRNEGLDKGVVLKHKEMPVEDAEYIKDRP